MADLCLDPGKWYRFSRLFSQISPPGRELAFELRNLPPNGHTDRFWERVSLPDRFNLNLDYIYIIDLDAGSFIISQWKDHLLTPVTTHYDLDDVLDHFGMVIKPPLDRPWYIWNDCLCENCRRLIGSQVPGILTLNFGIPTPMNELQERFFTDFVFMWHSYIDNPLPTPSGCVV